MGISVEPGLDLSEIFTRVEGGESNFALMEMVIGSPNLRYEVFSMQTND